MAEGARSYAGHSIVRFAVTNEEQKAHLDKAVHSLGLDIWGDLKGSHADVRVPPHVPVTALNQFPLERTLLHKDIGPLLIEERSAVGTDFHGKYHTAEEIVSFVQSLAKSHSDVVSVETIGSSLEGRDIVAVTVKAKQGAAPSTVIQAGQHAREWISPAASLHMLQTAANNAKASGGIDGYNLVVLPMVNPDGYQFTIDTDRMWRKNRDTKFMPKPTGTTLLDASSECIGVDLNRQWGYHWGKTQSGGQVAKDSTKPCTDTFIGESAMSEPEVKAAAKYLEGLSKKGKGISAFVDVHSYSQRLLPPGCNGYQLLNEGDEVTRVPLCYTIPCYIVLYSTLLCYYTMLCYAILCYTVLYCTILYYTTLYYTVLCYTIPYCTIP
jgi:hypothetical protein